MTASATMPAIEVSATIDVGLVVPGAATRLIVMGNIGQQEEPSP
jgi:hypothetical protein